MSKEIENKKTELISILKTQGFELDRFGHMIKKTLLHRDGEKTEGFARVKFGKISARLELRVVGSNLWHRKDSAYYKDIIIEGNTIKLSRFKLVNRKL